MYPAACRRPKGCLGGARATPKRAYTPPGSRARAHVRCARARASARIFSGAAVLRPRLPSARAAPQTLCLLGNPAGRGL